MSKYGIINVSVSTHYRDSSSTAAVTTQGLLGEKVEILDERESHAHILQADGYQSWIPADQLVIDKGAKVAGDKVLVLSHFLRIYAHPSSAAPAIRDAVIGTLLTKIAEHGEWYQIVLPDGSSGWAEKHHFGSRPEFTAESIVTMAQGFLGYQYFWGGISPKGFDCSGFVQTVFKLHGVQLTRDSWQQQQDCLLSTDFHDAQPGDLLFFSSKPNKVTHVAISLGEQRYIHASGWVRLESFREDDPVFTRQRSANFTSVNRYS